MTRVVITVEEGRVVGVYSDQEIDVEIVDIDTVDPVELEDALHKIKEVEADKSLTFYESY